MITITVEEVQNYLRINNKEDEDLIEDLIESASNRVVSFLNNNFEGEKIPIALKNAVIKIVAIEYENRSSYSSNASGTQILGSELINDELKKLYMYRKVPGL